MPRASGIALMVGSLGGAGSASAHAFLDTAVPAVGSTIRAAPAELVLTFTEGVEPLFSTITVQDQAGADMALGRPHPEGAGTRLAVGLKILRPGDYKVVWHVVSVDTHKTQGSYRFTIAP